ncbi:helix-turn-helix domain-containing protein, partial [Pseudomonas aeruginosa]|uniref:helix-turn-helix domain-containing protein n=1 Tax=Pseudomonas aeruginosa TaxID=287 RepID=UPI003967EED9
MNLDLAVYIGEKIKYFRKTHNWTQSQLGEKVGLAKSTVANYEKGFRTPQQDKLFDIADALGISVSDL